MNTCLDEFFFTLYLFAVNGRFFLFSCSVDFIFGLNKTKWKVHFLFAVFSKVILKSSALIANGEQQNNFKYAQCAQVVSNDWIQQQMLNFCCLPQTWFLAFIFLCANSRSSQQHKKQQIKLVQNSNKIHFFVLAETAS